MDQANKVAAAAAGEPRQELKVYITVVGVKKRCRKSERHHITVGNFPLDVDRAATKEQGIAKLRETMKSFHRAFIHFDYVTIRADHGFTTEEWRPFDTRHVVEELNITVSDDGPYKYCECGKPVHSANDGWCSDACYRVAGASR